MSEALQDLANVRLRVTAGAARLAVTLQRDSQQREMTLPVWVGNDRQVRLGLPVADPQHDGDMLQVIVSLPELLSALGAAGSAVEAHSPT